MKIILLNGSEIKDETALHAAFQNALQLPAWYGENLDALYDVLTALPVEIGVIAVDTPSLAKTLGKRWTAFLRLLRDVQKERSGFYVCFDPFSINKTGDVQL